MTSALPATVLAASLPMPTRLLSSVPFSVALRLAGRVVMAACAHCIGRTAVAFFMYVYVVLTWCGALETSIHDQFAAAFHDRCSAARVASLGRTKFGNSDDHSRQESATGERRKQTGKNRLTFHSVAWKDRRRQNINRIRNGLLSSSALFCHARQACVTAGCQGLGCNW